MSGKILTPAESEAAIRNAASALYTAVVVARQTIKALHGPVAWDIYEKHSPEMRTTDAALRKARGEP